MNTIRLPNLNAAGGRLLALAYSRRLGALQLPVLLLVALLQRTPLLRAVFGAPPAWVCSSAGEVLRSAAVAAVALGAVDTLAGATEFAATPNDPASATVGSPFAVVMAITGAPLITSSYSFSGVPPGLNVVGATTINGVLVVNGQTATISGTPTTAGSFVIGVTGWQFTNATGLNSEPKNYTYTINVTGGTTTPTAPEITTPPAAQKVAVGANATLTVTAGGTAPFTYQWRRNGVNLAGATAATLALTNVQPAHTGVYSVAVTNAAGTTVSAGAILGVETAAKVVGTGTQVGFDIQHPNGNVYDQVLITGAAATLTADPGQILRASFIDLSDDIIQLEFSGAGSLTVTLENPTGPAPPVNYNQTVEYMKGHATLTIVGADGTTNVSAFTVGSGTAVNQALFKPGTNYDGVADIAVINITSTNGQFGGVRCANTEFFAASGLTGVNAPGVNVVAVVNLHNVSASDQATPVLLTGTIGVGRIGITGGNMRQTNDRAIQVGDAQAIHMLAGQTSHTVAQPAQANQGVYERNGVNVTNSLVVNP